ncbi:MAG: hypothetical protein GXO39_10055 [Thermotogae bacterium]|nr:hypothetical protein [Thermotogota bacterium]
MLWILTWMATDEGVIISQRIRGDYVVEAAGIVYETVEHGAKTVSFKLRTLLTTPVKVEIKYWYDGEFYLKEVQLSPGSHALSFNLTERDGVLLPTRSIGARPTVITVKSEGPILLSEVEAR